MKKSQNHALKSEASEFSHEQNIRDIITPSTIDSTYLVAVVCAAASGGRKARGVFGFNTGKFGEDILRVRDPGAEAGSGQFYLLSFYGVYLYWRSSMMCQIRRTQTSELRHASNATSVSIDNRMRCICRDGVIDR